MSEVLLGALLASALVGWFVAWSEKKQAKEDLRVARRRNVLLEEQNRDLLTVLGSYREEERARKNREIKTERATRRFLRKEQILARNENVGVEDDYDLDYSDISLLSTGAYLTGEEINSIRSAIQYPDGMYLSDVIETHGEKPLGILRTEEGVLSGVVPLTTEGSCQPDSVTTTGPSSIPSDPAPTSSPAYEPSSSYSESTYGGSDYSSSDSGSSCGSSPD